MIDRSRSPWSVWVRKVSSRRYSRIGLLVAPAQVVHVAQARVRADDDQSLRAGHRLLLQVDGRARRPLRAVEVAAERLQQRELQVGVAGCGRQRRGPLEVARWPRRSRPAEPQHARQLAVGERRCRARAPVPCGLRLRRRRSSPRLASVCPRRTCASARVGAQWPPPARAAPCCARARAAAIRNDPRSCSALPSAMSASR